MNGVHVSRVPSDYDLEDTPFRTITNFFEPCANAVKQTEKARLLELFRSLKIDPCRMADKEGKGIYAIYRLMCPDVGREGEGREGRGGKGGLHTWL